MDPIAWKDDYLVGVREIDRQHQDLVKLINRLLIIHRTGNVALLVKRLLTEIVKFAEYHFVSEENIMLITRYPGLDRQHAEHERIIVELNRRIGLYHDGGETVEDLIGFLVTWFISHTTQEDKRIGQHINGNRQDGTAICTLTG